MVPKAIYPFLGLPSSMSAPVQLTLSKHARVRAWANVIHPPLATTEIDAPRVIELDRKAISPAHLRSAKLIDGKCREPPADWKENGPDAQYTAPVPAGSANRQSEL